MATLCPPVKMQFFDDNGDPLNGGKVYTYEPGTTTNKATYTDSTEGTPNANPVILDSTGRANIWLNGFYKIKVTDSADVQLYVIDQVSSGGSTTSTVTEWSDPGVTPVYLSTTTFSVTGDYTAVLQEGMGIKCTVTAGTVYGMITDASFAATTTTVTVLLDSGTLDSGLSAVEVGINTVDNPSLRGIKQLRQPIATKTGNYTLAKTDHTILVDAVGYLAKTTIAFVDGGGGNDSITDSASGFVAAGFEAGDVIVITGSDSNNITVTAISVVAGTIEVATGTFTAESAGASVSLKEKITITLPTASTLTGGGFHNEFDVILSGTGQMAFSGTISGVVDPEIKRQYNGYNIITDGADYHGQKKYLSSSTASPNTILETDDYNVLPSSRPPEDYRIRVYRDLFMTGLFTTLDFGDLAWNGSFANVANDVTMENGEKNIGIATTTTTNNTAYEAFPTGPRAGVDPDYKFKMIYRIKLGQTTDVRVKIGCGTDATTGDDTDVDAIVFHFDSAVSANWKAINRATSTPTETDTSIAASTNTIKFEILRRTLSQDGVDDLRYYIDDSLVATHTTNIPSPSSGIYPLMAVQTLTTAFRSIYTKYFYFYQNL